MLEKVESYEAQQARNRKIHERDDVLRQLGQRWRKAFGEHTDISPGSADAQFLDFAADLLLDISVFADKQARTASRAQWLAVAAAVLCTALAFLCTVKFAS